MHYTVAVVTNEDNESEIEDLLAPFDENTEVDPYIYNTKEEIIENFRESVEHLKKDMEAYEKGEYDTENYRTYWLKEDSEELTDYAKERLELYEKSDEEIYQWYRDGEDDDRFDENGNELSTYNPNSKWDWYTIGGRWDGYFNLKDGSKVNAAKISDVVWEGTPEEKAEAKEFWEQYIEGKLPSPGKEPVKCFYKKEYYTSRYNSKEDYIERSTATNPYAVVTPEGEWVAPGEMGWFSSSEDGQAQAEYENWLKDFISKHQDCYITLVDCHI